MTLTPQAVAAIGIDKSQATPFEIMTAILKSPVDLLWFGGIGTYVRGPTETDAEVGDRANDPIRITADEVGAKVIGEGANLGVTQRGRIAYRPARAAAAIPTRSTTRPASIPPTSRSTSRSRSLPRCATDA